MLRTRPFSTSPGIASSTIATASPGLTWPMLFSVRSALIHRSCIAISVITGAPGCANWPTSVRRSVTTPRAGATTCVRARSSSAFSTAATALRSCALSSPASPAASCALRRSARARLHLAARLVARGLRDLEAAHRDRAGILLVQLFQPAGVAFGHVAAGLGHRQRGPRRLDAGHRALDRTAHRFEVGARAHQRNAIRLRVDVEQRLAGLHLVVVADVHGQHLAGDFGRHRHDEGLHAGLRGARREPVADEVQHQAGDDQHGDDQGAGTGAAARGCGCGGRRGSAGAVPAFGAGASGGTAGSWLMACRSWGEAEPLPKAAARGPAAATSSRCARPSWLAWRRRAPVASGRPASRRPSPCRPRSGTEPRRPGWRPGSPAH